MYCICIHAAVVIGFQFLLYNTAEGNVQLVCLVTNVAPSAAVSVQVSSSPRGSGPNDATGNDPASLPPFP